MSTILPGYVSNETKYNRAILELKKTNQPVTDEAIKALYIKYGGFVIEKTAEEVAAKESAEGEESPSRRGRKPKVDAE